MLQKLLIKNYAIIRQIELTPHAGLNTITGETGAGKSIIVGALSLLLGDRADSAVILHKNEKAIVEGHFAVDKNEALKIALAKEDIDVEDICIIRREISPAGKSRAFVNDTPVNLPLLATLTGYLVDLHRQFDHLNLEQDSFALDAIEAFGGNPALLLGYKAIYTAYTANAKQLQAKQDRLAQIQKESSYNQHLLEELAQAAFKHNEIEDAALQLKQLNHAEKLVALLQQSEYTLSGGDMPFLQDFKKNMQQLASVADILPAMGTIAGRMASVYEELKDINEELAKEKDKVSLDPEKADFLQQRVDLGYKLLKKHALSLTNDLIDLQHHLASSLQDATALQADIDALAKTIAKQQAELLSAGKALSAHRVAAAGEFEKHVNNLLPQVGMPNARFQVAHTSIAPTGTGTDAFTLLLDANKTNRFLPIAKAASGGEMSRLLLCIKSLTAQAVHLPTLIFDEVDTGISGEAARQVGHLLRQLATRHQVICITHQPQIAAKGMQHYYVYKAEDANGLHTQIKTLTGKDRIMAIAQMIGGENPSPAALSNAEELIGEKSKTLF
ncbi:MAG: DNA repair protein RecN [Chitinophagia bacterium]|nr:DNA repair protein RecN [Chitinophagia bacterium]